MKVQLEFRVFVRAHFEKSCRSSKDLVQQQKEEIQRLRQESEEQTNRGIIISRYSEAFRETEVLVR